MVFGKNDLHLNGLELELHPDGSHTAFSKPLKWVLRSFLVVIPLTGMILYLSLESDYVIYAALTVITIFYFWVIYRILDISKSAYRVDISPTGFSMSVTKTSPFLTSVDGFYAWENIISYAYGSYSSDDTSLSLAGTVWNCIYERSYQATLCHDAYEREQDRNHGECNFTYNYGACGGKCTITCR
jgi:hypothetical protein